MADNKSNLKRILKIFHNVAFLFFLILIVYASYFSVNSNEKIKSTNRTEKNDSPLGNLLFSDNQSVSVSQKTPRDLFVKLMFESILVWCGDTKSISNAFQCVNTETINFNDDQLLDSLLKRCQILTVSLMGVVFNFDQIPLSVSGKTLEITLGQNDNKLTYYIKKKKNGDWYFTERNFTDPAILKVWNKHKVRSYKVKSIAGKSTPVKSYLNFIFGYQQKHNYTIENALKVMDLHEIPKLIRNTYGRFTALILYKILLSENVKFSSISSNPVLTYVQGLYMSPNHGAIYLERLPVANKSGTYRWVFTDTVIKNAINIYLNESIAPSVYDNIFIKTGSCLFLYMPFLRKSFIHIQGIIWVLMIICVFMSYFIFLYSKKIIFFVITFAKFFKSVEDYMKYAKRFSICSALTITLLFIQYAIDNTLIFYMNVYLFCFYAVTIFKTVLIIWWLYEIINLICSILLSILKRHGDESFRANFVVEIIRRLSCIIITIVLSGMLLNELGFNMLNFLTALGIGGLAIAFAGKDTIENLFGSIMLTMEKPFKIGDWIIIGDIEGNVEHVGLRSTRIRTFEDSYLTVPNVKFITMSVNNMGARTYRRFKTVLGIEDNTSTEMLKAFVDGIYSIIKETSTMRKSHYYVRINDFGESSINILVYIFFLVPDWATELKERETFILNILELAEQMNIKLAYPTRTLIFPKKNDNTSSDIDLKQLNEEIALAQKNAK